MSEKETIEVYVTRYALTAGIQRRRGHVWAEWPGMFVVPGSYGGEAYTGKDWHRDYPSALAQAEAMRDKKLKSLRKQIDKLTTLEFVQPTEAVSHD